MFRDLDWKSAARRSAFVVAIYLGLFYVLNAIFPESFGLRTRAEVTALLMNAFFFFLLFTVIYALLDRRRRRIMAEARHRSRADGPSGDENGASGHLKGRPNPNTSRKKTSRRKR